MELCVIELASNISFASYSELINRIERLEAGISSGETSAQSPHQIFKPAILNTEKPIQKVEVVSCGNIEENEKLLEDSTEENSDNTDTVTTPVQTKETISQQVPTTTSNIQTNTPDLAVAWQGILQNIESIPSRMFFYNLSHPVELSKEGIKIAFLKEIFVKQAQEASKNAPLKKAAMNYLGVNDINVHIILADENTNTEQIKPTLEKLEKKPQQEFKSNEANDTDDEDIQLIKNSVENYAENSQTQEVSQKYNDDSISTENLSDQSKMVMELFNGKYIE